MYVLAVVTTHVPPLRQGWYPHGFAVRQFGSVSWDGQIHVYARPLLLVTQVPALHGDDEQGLRIV